MITSGKDKGWKQETKEQNSMNCKYYQKLKETNMIVKLFMQTIETV